MLIELYIAIIVLMLLAIFTAISIWIMCSITRWFPEIKIEEEGMKRSNVLAWIMLLGITVCHASTTIQLGRYLTFTPIPVRHGLNQWVNYPINNSDTVSQIINSVMQSTGYHLLAENKSSHHVHYLYRKKLPHYLLRKRKITVKTFLIKAAGHHYQLVVDKTHHLVGYVVRPSIYVARKKNLLERIAAFTRGER